MTSKITKKEIIAMDKNACSIKGVINDVKIQIDILTAEIKVFANVYNSSKLIGYI